jgi:cytochrome c oxidase cbb3-type subunit 3
MMMIFSTYAQTPGVAVAPVAESVSLWSSPLFWVYAFAIISLLLVIVAIGSVLVGLVNNKLSEKIGKGAGLILLLILFAYQPANAQTTTLTNTTTQAVIGGLDPNTIIVLSVVVFIELFVILYLYSILQHMLVSLGYKSATESKWSWSAIMKRMTKSVPLERESEVATDHNYDGIVELDNSLPPWWVYMFYATILFSVVYIAYYQFGAGPTQLMEYDNAIAQAKIEKTAMLKRTASNVDENSVVALTDATDILKGKSSYITKCAACHGQNGEGGVGPNLTDEFWIHGGGVKNIFKTIKYGVQEKGMIAWQAQMQPTEMQQVVSFILTLKGTNPANAKAPQGNLYKEEAVTVDSTSNTHASDSTIVASSQ